MASRAKTAAAKPPTKAQSTSHIADKSGLTKAQVTSVFDALDALAAESLNKYKQFTIPNLVKVTVVRKKATPSRPGRNPSTGEAITIEAKPARDVVRVRALKQLKDMIKLA